MNKLNILGKQHNVVVFRDVVSWKTPSEKFI